MGWRAQEVAMACNMRTDTVVKNCGLMRRFKSLGIVAEPGGTGVYIFPLTLAPASQAPMVERISSPIRWDFVHLQFTVNYKVYGEIIVSEYGIARFTRLVPQASC